MQKRVLATGPATAQTMWAAYVDTSGWARWAPHIHSVDPLGTIHAGMRGVVEGPLRSRARFEVTSVDEAQRAWTWEVRLGPARLLIDHEVAEGKTAVTIAGPAPLVLAYAPIARRALERLANLPP